MNSKDQFKEKEKQDFTLAFERYFDSLSKKQQIKLLRDVYRCVN